MKPNKYKFISDCYNYAKQLGYEFDKESLDYLYETTHTGETVEEAVNDYLDAFER